MEETNGNKKEKKGFKSWLSGLGRSKQPPVAGVSGARSAVSSASNVAGAAQKALNMPSLGTITGAARSSGFLAKMVSALRLPSFLATRAGAMGMILGGITIASGMAAMSGFMGSPSKPSYNPGLFNNSYYDSLVAQAEKDRMSRGSDAAGSGSSLDLLQQQMESEQEAGEQAQAQAEKSEAPAMSASQAAAAAKKAVAAAPAAARAAAAPRSFGSSGFNFGGGGGGSSSNAPNKAVSGNLSGGGSSRGAAYSGAMRGASAPRGAYRQARSGSRSMSSAGSPMGKQAAASMFYDGGGTLGGDVSSVLGAGAGGGAPGGAGGGENDGSTDSVTPPQPKAEVPAVGGGGGGGGGESDTVTGNPLSEDKGAPWKNLAVAAVAATALGLGLSLAIFGLGKLRKMVPAGPWQWAIIAAQLILLTAVMFLAAMVAMIGQRILKEFGQQKEGILTMVGGAVVGIAGIIALILGNIGAPGVAAAGKAAAAGAYALAGGGVAAMIGGVLSALGVGTENAAAAVATPTGGLTDQGSWNSSGFFDSGSSATGTTTTGS